MIRVLHVLNNLGSGGAESFVMNVYRNIDRSKVQFDFLIRSNQNGEMVDEIKSMGGRIIIIPSFPRHFVSNYIQLNSFLKSHAKDYSAIHVHANALIYIKPLQLAKKYGIKKIVIHSHNTCSAYPAIHRFNINRVDKWVTDRFACSNMAGRFMFGDKSFTFVPNGINLKKFSYSDTARNRIREKYNISDSTVVVGHVGRFTYQKNHEKLLEIFLGYQKICPDSKLMLIGDGDKKEGIIALVNKYRISNDVIFTGSVTNVNEYLSAMDIFCLPSYYEGLAIVLIEAQANGLPCIVSDSTTKESNCGNVIFESINSPGQIWVERLTGLRRTESSDELLTRFDISYVSKELEKYYLL